MTMTIRIAPISLVVALLWPAIDWAEAPRALLEGHRLTLVASEPEVVTPIGVACNADGDLFVVESHTHKRTADYEGRDSDRVRRLRDSDGDGVLDQWTDFSEGYRHALNLLVRPDGGLYLVTRGDVRLLYDHDNDGRADQEEVLVHLDTEVDYPHNAMGGIWLGGEDLYLGMGENFGGR